MMAQEKTAVFRKACFSLAALFMAFQCTAAVYRRYAEFLSKGQIVVSFLLIAGIIVFGALFAGVLIWKADILQPLIRLKAKSAFLRRSAAVLVCFLPVALYIFHRWSEPFGDPWIRIFLYALAILLAAWMLEVQNGVSFGSLTAAALCFSVLFAFCSQFRDVNAYPFSVGWSEGNRMWDYSVLFGRHLYDWPQDQTIPAYIDIGRQSLWGSIFLLPKVTIGMVRGWNDLLFTVPYAILGWVLLSRAGGAQRESATGRFEKDIRESSVSSVRRSDPWAAERKYRFAAGLWAMLFLLQGPIYTPLVLSAILVAFGWKRRLPVALILTFLAGFYAVMSRSTWVVAPAAFAVMLSFVGSYDSDGSGSAVKKRWSRSVLLGAAGLLGAVVYLKRDWFSDLFSQLAALGASVAMAAQDTIESVSSVGSAGDPAMFSAEWFRYFLTRQPLIWSRLWPNETFQPGIVLGLIGAILPLSLLLLVWGLQKKWKLDGWQRFLLIFAQTAFLAVGILISVKIGGGSNLHNLDIFLIGLLFIGALGWEAGMGRWLAEKLRSGHWVGWIVLAAILLPVAREALTIEPKKYPAAETTADAIEKIQQAVEENKDGEILFLDQRQLLTFGTVPKVRLIADYEKKWMMDEAMADNTAFFEPYVADLKARRFDVIISEPLWVKFQGEGLDFSEENDLFVKWVSIPTLCYYEPKETFLDQGVQILVPRGEVWSEEGVVCP